MSDEEHEHIALLVLKDALNTLRGAEVVFMTDSGTFRIKDVFQARSGVSDRGIIRVFLDKT